jgi:predicted nucleic acid-binding protein
MFLDTSGLLCILDSRDHRHAIAADSYRQSPRLFTTNYVLTEFVALAHARGIPRQRALDFLKDLETAPRVEMIWIDKGLHERAMLLLEARLDKTYSLCDAVSFVVMRGRELQEALTTDKHFEQEGLTRLLQ